MTSQRFFSATTGDLKRKRNNFGESGLQSTLAPQQALAGIGTQRTLRIELCRTLDLQSLWCYPLACGELSGETSNVNFLLDSYVNIAACPCLPQFLARDLLCAIFPMPIEAPQENFSSCLTLILQYTFHMIVAFVIRS